MTTNVSGESRGIVEKYLSFQGRASRSEYWAIQLLCVPIFFLLMMIAVGIAAMGTSGIIASTAFIIGSMFVMGWLTLSTTARRCRDAGINPWFTLAVFIPYLGLIPWIVFGCLQTKKEIVNGNP